MRASGAGGGVWGGENTGELDQRRLGALRQLVQDLAHAGDERDRVARGVVHGPLLVGVFLLVARDNKVEAVGDAVLTSLRCNIPRAAAWARTSCGLKTGERGRKFDLSGPSRVLWRGDWTARAEAATSTESSSASSSAAARSSESTLGDFSSRSGLP